MDQDYTRVGDHVAVLRRRWWIVALCCLLGAVAGVLLVPLQAVNYTATAVVLSSAPAATDPTAAVDVATQSQLVTSDEVVQTVGKNLGLTLAPRDLENALSVEVLPDTTALSISVTLDDRTLAASVANEFASQYIATQGEALTASRRASIPGLETQLDETNQKLLAARDDVRGTTGSARLTAQQAVGRLEQQQRALNNALSEAQSPLLATETGSVLQRAVVPPAGSTARLRGVLLGLAVGLLVGLALAYWRHQRDDAVRGDDQLGDLLGGTPVLGRIPMDPGAKQGTLPGRGEGDPLAAEAYRSLAGNVRFRLSSRVGAAAPAHPGAGASTSTASVVVVTSPDPGAGKTTIACNLALSAAATGLRVLLVDADLHRPQVAAVLGLETSAGLADALASEKAKDLPIVHADGGLRVLTSGTYAEDPFAALLSPRAEEVWASLRAEAELVVVDTAPLLYASESVSVAARADHVLLVLEPGRSTAADVEACVERLEIAGRGVSGAVLNRVRPKELAGGYYGSDGAAAKV